MLSQYDTNLEDISGLFTSGKCLVQLTSLVEVTSRYFLTERCHSSNSLTIMKKQCKMGQTGHAKFIRLGNVKGLPLIT